MFNSASSDNHHLVFLVHQSPPSRRPNSQQIQQLRQLCPQEFSSQSYTPQPTNHG